MLKTKRRHFKNNALFYVSQNFCKCIINIAPYLVLVKLKLG